MLGPHLPQRLRADPAVQRPGGGVLVPAPGLPVPLAGAVRQDRAAVPRGGGVVCPGQQHHLGEVRQGRPQGRGDAPPSGAAGRYWPFRGRAIGVAQEFQRVWTAYERPTRTGARQFSFTKADRRVSCYYFSLWDEDFGPAFVKVCGYFPYPVKVWVNGHEWAKRQAAKAGLAVTELSNGFAACAQPERLQAICDRLGPATINVFVQRWLGFLPLPLCEADRDGGYWWECSMRQVEVSRTIVFDAPRHARGFFEALIADNLDPGRPANVEIIFGRQLRRNTKGTFRTAIDRR